MMKYSTGFLFSPDMASVVLVKKERPQWQAGKYNGVGGKLEAGETPHDAMVREFREETSVEIPVWTRFCTLGCPDNEFRVTFFYATSEYYNKVKSVTDESIHIWDVQAALSSSNIIPNLHWLIPMVFSFSGGERAKEFTVTEVYDEVDPSVTAPFLATSQP